MIYIYIYIYIYISSNNVRHPVTKTFTPLHFTQLHFTPLHYTCRHFISFNLNITQLHFTTLSFGLEVSLLLSWDFIIFITDNVNRFFVPWASIFHGVRLGILSGLHCIHFRMDNSFSTLPQRIKKWTVIQSLKHCSWTLVGLILWAAIAQTV